MTKKSILNITTGSFTIVDLPIEEQIEHDAKVKAYQDGSFDRAILKLRKDRNLLLAETDYLALSDNTMSAEQTKYRKDLRDLTNGLDTVEKVEAKEFPTKPSGE